MPIRNSLKKTVINLSVSLLSAAIFIGSAELIFRIKYTPEKIDYKWIFEYDREKMFRLKKNHTGSFAGHAVVTNSHGHRDSEIPVQKPPKTIRLLVIGDSVSFGHGVDGNQTYPEYLEDLLNSRSKQYRFDVINTSAPGNSAFQEYYDLKRGLKFNPDLIIQQFTLNDVTEPYHVYKRLGGKGKDYHGIEDIPYYDHLLRQYSALYLFLKDMTQRAANQIWTKKELKEKAQSREIYAAKNLIKRHNHPLIKEAWDEYFRWLKKIHFTAEKFSLPTILLAAPYAFQFSMDDSLAYPQKKLRGYSERNNIIFVDLLAILQDKFMREVIQKYKLPEDADYQEIIAAVTSRDLTEGANFWAKYFLDYDHFTSMGHKLTAEILFTRVINALELEKLALPGDSGTL